MIFNKLLFCYEIKLEYICNRFKTSGENRERFIAFTIIHFIMDLLKYAQDEFIEKKDFPEFSSGDTITVYYEIKEGQKTRVQFFRGTVLQTKGTGLTKTFTIRKMSGTVGVERIFPINMPSIQKIEVNKRGSVRRSRIYYFRKLTGKKARIKEQVKK